ncbi:MAG TPA: hypothetical protein PLQ12_11420, partial [Candidatus Defluviicoccus seviourii]|nr:hypothetical protein [Candidatus Defluviicoccus seviourii]
MTGFLIGRNGLADVRSLVLPAEPRTEPPLEPPLPLALAGPRGVIGDTAQPYPELEEAAQDASAVAALVSSLRWVEAFPRSHQQLHLQAPSASGSSDDDPSRKFSAFGPPQQLHLHFAIISAVICP